jgi:hypothetical protein
LAEYSKIERPVFVQRVSDRLMSAALYLAVATAAGFGPGWIVALNIVAGRFRRLARHKWIYDITNIERKEASSPLS